MEKNLYVFPKLDKQVRISLFNNQNNLQGNPTLQPTMCRVVKFNIDNYYNITSAKLYAYIYTQNPGSTCHLELYDHTSNRVIANAYVQTTDTNGVWVESSNILFDIPKYRI